MGLHKRLQLPGFQGAFTGKRSYRSGNVLNLSVGDVGHWSLLLLYLRHAFTSPRVLAPLTQVQFYCAKGED